MKFFKLRAMADSRKDIRNQMNDSRRFRFLEHSCYIIESNNQDDIQHWATELYSFCSWIMNLKPAGTYKITKDFILQHYFGCGEDLESFIPALRDAHYYIYKNYDYEDSAPKFDRYREFVNKVAEQLTTRKLTQVSLQSLVDQYLAK